MPTIKFWFTRDKHCTVDSSNGPNDTRNIACIRKVAKHVTNPKFNDAKLVYVVHGWSVYNPWRDSYLDWLLDLKNSLLKRYKKGHIVVGIVYWIHGSRAVRRIMPSNSSYFYRNILNH